MLRQRTASQVIPMWLRFVLIAVYALAFATAVSAEEASVRPGINRNYEHPDFDRWVATFERPGREVYDRRGDIVAASGVRAGMTVADIGAGTGLFTRLFARAVGSEGKVYAVDISLAFVHKGVERAKAEGFANVEGVVNDAHGTGLPASSVDLAFICDTYHHLEYPQDMLRSIRRALRSTGTLMVVDFRRQPGESSGWVLGHVRAGRATVIQEIEAAGFRLLEDSPLLHTNYLLRFAPQSGHVN